MRYSNVRAAIKLQFRDVDSFVHKDFRDRKDIRYVKKTMETRLSQGGLRASWSKRSGETTAFGWRHRSTRRSVDLCQELGIEIIKVASSDITDWVAAREDRHDPETGHRLDGRRLGARHGRDGHVLRQPQHPAGDESLRLALSRREDSDLELNQIDYLRNRYPDVTIGLSTHEYRSWTYSIIIAYAKGARTFERHIDIDTPDHPVSPVLLHARTGARSWFEAFHKAKEMCGGSAEERRRLRAKEVAYLDALVRGVYAKRDLPAGHALTDDDYYLAIPLQKGQISCRELISGDVLTAPVKADQPLTIDMFDNPYSRVEDLRRVIMERGL